jgi:hypothetical protein
VQADILAEAAEADGVGRGIVAGLNGDGAPLGGRCRSARADAGEALRQNAEVVEAPVRSVGGQIFVIAVVGVLDVGPQERDILHDLRHFILVGDVGVEGVAAGNDGQGNNNSEQNLCQVQANLLPFVNERTRREKDRVGTCRRRASFRRAGCGSLPEKSIKFLIMK